jgi:hypothetical protein
MALSSFGRKQARRVLVSVVATTVAALAVGGVAVAADSETTDFTITTFTCVPGDVVTLTGKQHTTMGDDGRVYVNLSDVKGVAMPSGNRYVETSINHFDPDGNMVLNGHVILTRLGEDGTLVTGDDLHFRFQMQAGGPLEFTNECQ